MLVVQREQLSRRHVGDVTRVSTMAVLSFTASGGRCYVLTPAAERLDRVSIYLISPLKCRRLEPMII